MNSIAKIEQIQLNRQSPSYWQVIFDNPPLNLSTKTAIDEAIRGAFVFEFRFIMVICVGLALGSAALALFLFQEDRDHPKLHGTVFPEWLKTPENIQP
jgi:hypothetical protein